MTKSLTGFLFLFILLFSSAHSLQAQQKEDLKYRKWRVTLFPPLSTNGIEAPDYSARYSINLLYGYHGALDGFEFGTLVNYNKYYSSGFSIAGFANISAGEIEGAALAGGFNISANDISGLHFAGLGNIAKGNVEGLLLTGFGNIANGSIEGLSVAGFGNIANQNIEGLSVVGGLNYSGNNTEGLHVAGIGNISGKDQEGLLAAGILNFSGGNLSGLSAAGGLNIGKEIEGLSAAGIANIGDNMEGLQFASVNLSGTAEGLQIGLVNIAREFEGMPIGLLSLYGNGRKNIDLRFTDAGFTEVGLNLGTYRVSNMIIFGYNNSLSRDIYRLGWAIGYEKNIKDVFKNASNEDYYITQELSIVRNFERKIDFDQETNLIWSYKYLFGKKFGSGLSVYGGPSLNMQVSRISGSSDYTWYSLWSPERKGRQYRFWIGFNLGIRIFKQKTLEPINDFYWDR
ncbi:hypothetical protein AB2B38_001085 [Balneola sp. MJW-20]|uniref:hypothetical protein n=1 Tax=Gracilimonas aurantiaca TaxID=3234185 RepID=UPI0034652FFB